MNTNPFNITKAVDYSDEQINSYWVDFSDGGFAQAVKPTSPMPMLILGGKGSGKTHIMRYFSYGLQKLRYNNDPKEGFKKDGYLGIYMRCSGLNSNRFKGKGQSDENWSSIFSYYTELWLSQLVLSILIELRRNSSILDEDHAFICKQIHNLFDAKIDQSEFVSFVSILRYLETQQKEVDYHINNISLTGGDLSKIKIVCTSGKLIFGIPKIIESRIKFLNGAQFLYLIDEFENLTTDQQKYINTLLREKESPSTFRIGGRLYGVRTYKTFSAEEDNKIGSEYELFNIDKEFREREDDYKKWAKTVCVKKLINSGYAASIDNESQQYIDKYFKSFTVDELNDILRSKKDKNSRVYFNELSRALLNYKVLPDQVSEIISNLSFDENRLLERANVFLFYRKWKDKKEDFLLASLSIKESCLTYQETKSKQTLHFNALEKYKNDLIDKLCRESNEPTPYLGLDNFIKMSAGIPRHLLIILKHVFRWSNFNGESPFVGQSVISRDSQKRGLNDAASWFLEDARMPGENGDNLESCIRKLGNYLRAIRFSQTPPECSLSSFRIDKPDLENDLIDILDFMEQYSYIVNVPERRDKNSDRRDMVYQVNGLIAPYFELSIHRRGVISINSEDAKTIFRSENDRKYKALLNATQTKYNPPFGSKNPTLF